MAWQTVKSFKSCMILVYAQPCDERHGLEHISWDLGSPQQLKELHVRDLPGIKPQQNKHENVDAPCLLPDIFVYKSVLKTGSQEETSQRNDPFSM